MHGHDTIVLDGDLSLVQVFDGEFGIIIPYKDYVYPAYTGETTVIPRTVEQVLDTDHKTVMEDIKVTEIPYAEVSNPSGGLTVNIG